MNQRSKPTHRIYACQSDWAPFVPRLTRVEAIQGNVTGPVEDRTRCRHRAPWWRGRMNRSQASCH